MKYLQAIVKEYKEHYLQEEVFEKSINGEIKRIQKALLDEKFLPSVGLKTLFKKLLRRSKYPMEIAIVGQFSSGKSTFLNALLAKDVLPTGITPVTSKVNFINYGEEYKLKVNYNNGANEFHSLEMISEFTDQRKAVKDIKYLTLYAPMDILKDISFVDTPGLNSQSLEDTQTTKKILRDVDGIIWLTLIDNAAKESEAEILNEFLENFADKSLCVLNQKDKFTPQEVATTLAYIQERFSCFFSHVIPISAKQALDSRVNQKEVLIENALCSLQKKFKNSSISNKEAQNLSFFENDFAKFSQTIEDITQHDNSNDEKMMQDSNIAEVLHFLENTIRPKAIDSKAFAIKKDLSSICDILVKEYETILGVYESLLEILRTKENEILEAFDAVYAKYLKALILTFEQIDSIMQTIAETMYENIKSKTALRYETQTTLFHKEHVQSHAYETLFIDSEAIMQKLFYENALIDKQIKAAIAHLRNTELQSSEDFKKVFQILKNAVKSWQEPYELIKKNREIASDLEFANTRQFVAKVYENIILSYHSAILGNIAALHKKFAFFSGAFSFSYMQITEVSVFEMKENIDRHIKIYESDPLKYSLNIPSVNSILETVKKNFKFDKMETFLVSRRNYLYKTVETSKEQFKEINAEQINYVIDKKQVFIDKIKEIQAIQKSLEIKS